MVHSFFNDCNDYVHGEGYDRDVSCVLNLISTFLLRLHICIRYSTVLNRMGGIVSVFASSAVDHEFESRSGQTAKHTALRRKSKDWLAQDQDNVCE